MTTKTNKTILVLSIAATILLTGIALTSGKISTATAQSADQVASTDSAATASGLPCNTSAPTRAASFLTIDEITGLNGKSCAFEIKDFSFGVENPSTIGSATGGAGAGKVKFNEFTIKKTTDSASPAFFKNIAAGAHYKEVTLTMRKAGGDPAQSGKPFLVFKFDTVFTTKIDWSGPGDEGPEEQITFVYGKLVVEYHPQKTDGTLGVPITSCWDAVRNTMC